MMNFMFKMCNQRTALNVAIVHVRKYVRWEHRTPIKVIPAEEYDETELNENVKKEKFKIKWRNNPAGSINAPIDMEELDRLEHRKPIKPKKVYTIAKKKFKPTDMLETTVDPEGNFVYTKMNDNDARVGSLLTTLKSRNEKIKKDLILLEGKRLIKEALQTGCYLKYLLFTRKDEIEYLKPFLPKYGAQLYKMPYREMQMWSSLTTSPGIMGIFKTPVVEKFVPTNSIPLTIICDNVREPGNLGSIIRASAGLGCEKVILTKGCVNLWDTKVTRSSAGCHFRIQIQSLNTFDEIKRNLNENSRVFIADNSIVNSNEPTNLSELIYSMPFIPYYSLQLNRSEEIILIIGGETEGISEDSYKLAQEFKGVRLNIPLSNGVESLNAGTALGIIGFEIKRQLENPKKYC